MTDVVLVQLIVSVAPVLMIVVTSWLARKDAKAAAALLAKTTLDAETQRAENAKVAAATAAAAAVTLTQIHTSVNSNHAEDVKRLDAALAEINSLKEKMVLTDQFTQRVETARAQQPSPAAAVTVAVEAIKASTEAVAEVKEDTTAIKKKTDKLPIPRKRRRG